jgi:hypothetical protein
LFFWCHRLTKALFSGLTSLTWASSNVRRSTFAVRRSTFNVQRSTAQPGAKRAQIPKQNSSNVADVFTQKCYRCPDCAR